MGATDPMIVFSAITFHNPAKVLEKDKDGYYKVILGGFNTFNQSGAFYLSDNVKEIITDKTSILARRIESGFLKGEADHPALLPGMTKKDFFLRNMQLELTRISHSIKSVEMIQTDTPSGLPGKGNVIRVEGWIKPAGPYGDALLKDLEDPNVNVAFSIRSFTMDVKVNGTVVKEIKQIVTWDWVVEPGIKMATKWDKLSLETRDICSFSVKELLDSGALPSGVVASLESADVKAITDELISRVKSNYNTDHFKHW